MDLPTLMTSLDDGARATLLNLIARGVANTPKRARTPSLMKLVRDINDAAHVTPTLDQYRPMVLGMLVTAPRGKTLAGINSAVLELLQDAGRISPHDGKWFITAPAARTLHDGGYLDREIAKAAAEAGQRG